MNSRSRMRNRQLQRQQSKRREWMMKNQDDQKTTSSSEKQLELDLFPEGNPNLDEKWKPHPLLSQSQKPEFRVDKNFHEEKGQWVQCPLLSPQQSLSSLEDSEESLHIRTE